MYQDIADCLIDMLARNALAQRQALLNGLPLTEAIEESYGTETINLVLARAYLLRLPGNNRVMRYLSQHHGDLLTALKTVVEEATPVASAAPAG